MKTTEKQDFPQLERVLFIVAHPDDPEFGAGGTVARWAREGVHVTYVIVTDGSKGSNNVKNPFGALLDSVVDRYSEGAIFLGLAIYFSIEGGPKMVTCLALTGLGLISAFLVSYVRARAEGLQVECKVGLMQRPERLVLITLGVLFRDMFVSVNFLIVALWVLVILSHITVLQRVAFALKEFHGIRA